MKILIILFALVLLALAGVMLYDYWSNPLEVLEEGQVKVKSHYQDRIVSAPIRKVRRGRREFWQVKVPDGGWYNCRAGDCAETLRIEYVDHQFKRMPNPEPGSVSPYTEEH